MNHNLDLQYVLDNPELSEEIFDCGRRLLFRRVYAGPRGSCALRVPVNNHSLYADANPACFQQKLTFSHWECLFYFKGSDYFSEGHYVGQGSTPLEALKEGIFSNGLQKLEALCP